MLVFGGVVLWEWPYHPTWVLCHELVGTTLLETNSSHLKMDGWNTILSFWDGLFSGAFAASFRKGIQIIKPQTFCPSIFVTDLDTLMVGGHKTQLFTWGADNNTCQRASSLRISGPSQKKGLAVYDAGFFWISSPHLFWDPMILRVYVTY